MPVINNNKDMNITSSAYKSTYTPSKSYGYSVPSDVQDMINKIPTLSVNIDKVFKLSSEDKAQVWKMIDSIIEIYSKGTSESYTPGQVFKLRLLYNTLYNSDYLCTNRDKNLSNLLDG